MSCTFLTDRTDQNISCTTRIYTQTFLEIFTIKTACTVHWVARLTIYVRTDRTVLGTSWVFEAVVWTGGWVAGLRVKIFSWGTSYTLIRCCSFASQARGRAVHTSGWGYKCVAWARTDTLSSVQIESAFTSCTLCWSCSRTSRTMSCTFLTDRTDQNISGATRSYT